MKLVIDIDEDYVRIINKNGASNYPEEVIKNGTPLPKGHGRLIDADALQMEMDKDVRRAMSFVDLKDFVWLAPTIIEADKEKEDE